MYSNYKILYSPNVENKLNDFVDYMAQTCRYKDSWLYDEDLIVDNFINDIKIFIRDLKALTESKIKSWIIWQIDVKNNDFIETKLVIFLRSYNIVYKCIVIEEEKIITLENIHIKS